MFKVGLFSQFLAICGAVQKTVERSDKLHTSLFCYKLHDMRIDRLIACHNAKLLPAESDISISDRREMIQLIHLGQQVMGQRLGVSQSLQEHNYRIQLSDVA